MSRADTRLERLDDIERKLASRPQGWTTGELAQEYGLDSSTIFRDLAILQSMGTGLIKQGRRYMLDYRRSPNRVRLSHNEVLALYLAARLLSRHSDEHNPHVVTALEKLGDALRNRSPLIARHIEQAAAAVRARRTRPTYIHVLEILTQGWAEGHKVLLRYQKKGEPVSERLFAPYFIEPSGIGYACYVIGRDELRGAIRTLKVERITEAELTAESFSIPADFDPQQLLANAWGVIWRDEGAVEVILRFDASVVWRIKESVWHHTQRVADLPDGSCLFTVLVGSTMEMKPWIRQWGAAVEVLAPAELRAELVEEVRTMVRTYCITPESPDDH